MTPDLYAPCPCGSGKKFKWCCQPIYVDINRALEQDPFGLWLRALFRYQEGETRGALLLARKAADASDPEARDQFALVYRLIFDCEMRRNCPVAARAALRLVAHYAPADEEVRTAFENVFGEQGRLPLAARRDYPLLSPPPGLAGTRRGAPAPPPAWFNLALSRAWLGQNAPALEALDRYLALAPEDATAAEAAA